jgi:hypothetical protein
MADESNNNGARRGTVVSDKVGIQDSIDFLNLSRQLSKQEMAFMKKVAQEASDKIRAALPEDLKNQPAISIFCQNKKIMGAESSQLLRAAKHMNTVLDAGMSMRIIENDPNMAVEMAKEKQVLRRAIKDVNDIVSRKLKLRSSLFKRNSRKKKDEHNETGTEE